MAVAERTPTTHLRLMRILDVDQVAASDAALHTAHLIAGERVHALFVASTGAILFTERRILIVQREHLLEERLETSSFPYREVRHFSIQEGGRTALRIWLGADPQPLHLRANSGTSFADLQQLLAERLA